MKKAIGIIVLGLLLVSCSEYQEKRMLENCADGKFLEQIGPRPIIKASLKAKLLHGRYYVFFGWCEEELKTHGIRFKEKYK